MKRIFGAHIASSLGDPRHPSLFIWAAPSQYHDTFWTNGEEPPSFPGEAGVGPVQGVGLGF